MYLKFVVLLLLQSAVVLSALRIRAWKRATSKHDCECIDVTMVCSFRDRTSFGPKDRCKGKTTHVLLNGNRIASLPSDAFTGLTQLEWLVLASNNLTTLPKDVLKETRNLQNLLLNRNQIKSLPEGIFAKLNKLTKLDLSDNRLQKLPTGIFSGLSSIKSIMLSKNVLSSLQRDMFRGLTSLEVLDLSHNQIPSLPRDVFRDLSSLKSLTLSFNKLSAIEGKDVIGLKSLEALKVDHNLLTALPWFHSLWPAVDAAFYFGGNRIGDVAEDVLRSWLVADGRRLVVVLSSAQGEPSSSPDALRWVVGDAEVQALVGGACHCGALRRRAAEIRLCVRVRCGGKGQPRDWLAAVSTRRF